MKKNKHLCCGYCYCILFFMILLILPISVVQAQNTNDVSDPNYQQQQFNPSLAVIIVILVAALFLMGFFSIYIRHCADSPNATVLPTTGAPGRSRRGTRGLDRSVIDTFPILDYSEVKIHKIGKEVLECAVCLCEFEDTETLRLIPKCDHVFHPECIDEWLASHTTCPVCRANLVPQPGESVHALPLVPDPDAPDIEAQNDAVEAAPEHQQQQQEKEEQEQSSAKAEAESAILERSKTLNRNRTRGRSSRRRRFPRSHSTGHSLVQPGENTDRFTLKLPAGVRKEIINRELQRANSLVVLPREGSSRVGYRTGEGSSRGKILRRLNRSFKSDRWVFTMAPPFLVRGSSVIRSPRVGNSAGEGTSSSAAGDESVSAPIMPPTAVDSARPPV